MAKNVNPNQTASSGEVLSLFRKLAQVHLPEDLRYIRLNSYPSFLKLS